MNIQWMEEQEHGRDVAYWVGGVPCGTYREACIAAGADLPEQIEEEARWQFEQDCIEEQDRLEIAGPTFRVDFDGCPY